MRQGWGLWDGLDECEIFRCCAEFSTLPDNAPPGVGRFRSLCGGGVRIRGWVGIRQLGSDFNEGVHNLAGVQNSAQQWPAILSQSTTEYTALSARDVIKLQLVNIYFFILIYFIQSVFI